MDLRAITYLLTIIICLSGNYKNYAQVKTVPLPAADQQKADEFKALAEKAQTEGNASEAANFYNKAAFTFWNHGSTKEALDLFLQSLEINKSIGNNNAIQAISTNIGLIYSDVREYSKAIDYFQKSLQINKARNNKQQLYSNYINIALAYQSSGKYNESNQTLESALDIAEESNDIKSIKNCYSMLAENYQKLGQTEKSYEYFDKFSAIDKHLKEQEIENIADQKKQLETEKKEQELELQIKESALILTEKISEEYQKQAIILEKEKQLQELALKEEQARKRLAWLIIYSSAGGILLLLVIAVILIGSIKQKQKVNAKLASQNHEILKQQEIINLKNKNINDSINYARRIQKALLPSPQLLQKFIPESFILFEPKDKVSGDFFFFSTLVTQHGSYISGFLNKISKAYDFDANEIVLSAVDCTGHGVPGAFMSMIGFNLLNEIISAGIQEPDQILNNLHVGIKNSLRQDTTEIRDGMDLSLCVIRKNKKIVEFAGAKNPVIYFKNNQLFEIKGDLQPIGGFEKENEDRKFTKKKIEIDEPTTFYIFTDGFADQIGGDNGKKFMSKKFKELLAQIHQKPMEEQKTILLNAHQEWKGTKYNQVDDILVIGFKLT